MKGTKTKNSTVKFKNAQITRISRDACTSHRKNCIVFLDVIVSSKTVNFFNHIMKLLGRNINIIAMLNPRDTA